MKSAYPETVNSLDSDIHSLSTHDLFYIIAENTSDLILHFRVTPKMELKYASPSTFRIVGYTPEEFYADRLLLKKIVHPEERELLENFVYADAAKDQKPTVLRWIHKNGNTVWTEQTKTTIRNKRGEPTDYYFICRDITEHKLAENKLQEAQAFNTILLDNAPHAKMLLNPDTSVEYVNPAWEKLNGWTLAEVAGIKAPYPWWPDEYKDVYLERFQEAIKLRSGKGEVFSRKKNGEFYWIDMNWAAVTNNGDLRYIVINSIDITERKRVEEAVKTLSARQEAILSAVPDIIMEVDANKVYTWANRAGIEFFGDDVIGKSADYYFEGQQDTYEKVQPIFSGYDDVIYVESWQRRKDGEKRLLAWWCRILKDDKGNVSGALSTARDITESRKMEDALSHEVIRRRILVEQSRDGIVILELNGKVYEANNRFAEMLGYSPQEVLQLSVWDWEYLYPPEQVAEMIRTVDETGDHFETRHRRKDGSVFDVEISTNGAVFAGQKLIFCVCRDISERKRMEEALKSSEEKFSKVFASSPNAICIVTVKEGTFIEVNESFMHFTGYSREETIGSTPVKLGLWTNKDDAKRIDKILEETGRLNNEEIKSRMKTGEIRTGLFSAETIDIGDRKCMILEITDITEQVKAKEALRESEEKFSVAFRSSPDMMSIIDMQVGKYVEVNDSYVQVLGYSRQELIGRTVEEVGLFASREEFNRISGLMLQKGSFKHEEAQIRTKTGQIRTLLLSAEITNVGGVPCALSVAADITGQVKAKEALRESEEKFSAAFRSSPDMISIVDMQDGKYVEANDSFLSFSEYSREELIGHTLDEIKLWDHREEADRMTQMLPEKGKIRQEEMQVRTKSGKICTCMFSADIIKVSGKPCLLIVATDITERKKAEKALRESEEKFSKAFNSSPDMVFITSSEGRYLEVNETYTRISGYTREEVIGKKTTEINTWVEEGDRDKVLSKIKNQGHIYNEECQFRVKSGEIHTILFSTEVLNIGGERCLISVGTDITKRQQAEKALRESEEKFSLAFNSSPDMMAITDLKDGKYVEVNDSFIRNTGYSREELLTHDVTEFNLWVKQEDADKMTRLMQAENKIRNEEFDFRTKSGEIRTWLCSADIITIGGKMMMLAVASDVTERKKVREALRESEEKFSKAFHSSPFSISIGRLSDERFIEVNDAFLRDKGYTREEIFGHSSKELNIWADLDESQKILKSLLAGERIYNEEAKFRTKAGSIRTGLISAEIISLGNETCIMVINNDITQQKQAEEQLRLLSSVTQQVSDSIIIVGSDFNITYINQAAQNLFGYTIEEIRGKPLAFFNETSASDAEKRAIENIVSRGEVYNKIISKRCKDGRVIICDCRLTPLYDEKGQIRSYIDVERDITRQKEVEERLQEHKKLIDSILATMPEGVIVIDNKERIILANEAFQNIFHTGRKTLRSKSLHEILPADQFYDLHKAVKSRDLKDNTLEFRYTVQGQEIIIYCVMVKMDGERTLLTFSDISKEREEEEKLYMTDRLASLGEMAAGLAHELNNPLTGILALSQLLTGGNIPGEYKEDLVCIHEEAKRAAGIVKNVLLFARNKTDDNGQSSINEVLTDVLRLREYEEKANNIKVATNLGEKLPYVPIDSGQLQQVFLNIISNAEAAIKETSRPGLITVTTERVNNHINIIFKDNGCGIKKNIMPRIFDPFFTTKEIGKGTGLGLSICYSIIVKHGGKINVSSQVNEGATFTIRMPIVM